jgi:hypothetical protein
MISAVIARLDRAIQYAATSRLKHNRLWNTGSPAFAGDDSESAVIAGLDPAIIFKRNLSKIDGWPGHRRAKATPFFERLCPAMTSVKRPLPRLPLAA